jgi:hypothetical protein
MSRAFVQYRSSYGWCTFILLRSSARPRLLLLLRLRDLSERVPVRDDRPLCLDADLFARDDWSLRLRPVDLLPGDFFAEDVVFRAIQLVTQLLAALAVGSATG